MAVKDFFIVNGTRYTSREIKINNISPKMKVSSHAKVELSNLLKHYTPLNETSNLITDESGNICFEYSINCNKLLFIQESQKNSFIKFEIENQNSIIF